MPLNIWQKLSKYQQLSIIILGMLGLVPSEGQARQLNAGFVMNEMNVDQQVSYIAGVVEGLAYSRYLRDKPDQTGMQCVYDWYKKTDVQTMDTWLARHPEKPVGVLLYVLIKRDCGGID